LSDSGRQGLEGQPCKSEHQGALFPEKNQKRDKRHIDAGHDIAAGHQGRPYAFAPSGEPQGKERRQQDQQNRAAVKKPVQHERGENRSLVYPLPFSEHVNPGQFSDTRRKKVVGHVSDGNGGKEVGHGGILFTCQQQFPAECPCVVAEQGGGHGRRKKARIHRPQGLQKPVEIHGSKQNQHEENAYSNANPELQAQPPLLSPRSRGAFRFRQGSALSRPLARLIRHHG